MRLPAIIVACALCAIMVLKQKDTLSSRITQVELETESATYYIQSLPNKAATERVEFLQNTSKSEGYNCRQLPADIDTSGAAHLSEYLAKKHNRPSESAISNQPEGGKHRIIVWHALHKGGSSAFVSVMFNVCAAMGLPVYSHNKIYGEGRLVDIYDLITPDCDDSEEEKNRNFYSIYGWIPPSTSACIGPVRNYEDPVPQFDPKLYDVHQVYLVRDPRDSVVSAYFSFGYTHGGSDGRVLEKTIDDWALTETMTGTAQFYKKKFKPLLKAKDKCKEGKSCTVVTYDELVMSYPTLLNKILRRLPGVQDPEMVSSVVYHRTCCNTKNSFVNVLQQNFKPREEKVDHVRAAIPGNHQVRLKEETVANLSVMFQKEVDMIKENLGGLVAYAMYTPPAATDWSAAAKPKQG